MDVSHLYLVMRTVLQMLHDRQYIVPFLFDDGTDKRRPQKEKKDHEFFLTEYDNDRDKMALAVYSSVSRNDRCVVMFLRGKLQNPL